MKELALRIILRCISQSGPLDTTCIVWQGNTVGSGYGRIKYHGVEYLTHRVICEYMHGPIPEGQVAMHACDNPACCNPFHIKPATPKENVADAFAKGRRRYTGSSAKLNQKQVEEIRKQLANGVQHKVIAAQYKVARTTISMISSGRNW